jgi:hypothetical protein
LRLLDFRGPENIEEILNNVPVQFQEPDIFSQTDVLIEKLLRRNYDSNNAIVTIVNPSSPVNESVIKTYYDPNVEKLFTRSYQVDCGDTVYTTDIGNEWVVAYSSLPYHSKAGSLSYPNKYHSSVLTTPLTAKQHKSYDDLLNDFLTFTTTIIDTTGSHQFDKEDFAIYFRTMCQFGEADYFHHVIVADDSIYCRLELKGKDTVIHRRRWRLDPKEKQKIYRMFNESDLTADKPYVLPVPTGYFPSFTVLVVAKDGKKEMGGAFIDPIKYPYCLSKIKSVKEVYNDCRRHSATFNGDFITLYEYLETKYSELDSLQRSIGMK